MLATSQQDVSHLVSKNLEFEAYDQIETNSFANEDKFVPRESIF